MYNKWKINFNEPSDIGKDMNLKKRDFINLADFDKESIVFMLDLAARLKQETKVGIEHKILKGKTVVMYFAKPSLRTRLSFETGIYQLGGNPIVVKQEEIILGSRESIEDTARVISRYADGITIRTFAHSDVEKFAQYADIPVINALTDSSHPCQIMADLLTIKEKFGNLENLKLAYVGDGNNITNSLLIGCSMLGMDISVGCPEDYEPDKNYIAKAEELALISGSKIEIIQDPYQAVKYANVVYGDTWTSMGQESEAEKRRSLFRDYQINSELLEQADADCIVLHCLPAHKGEEITEEVFELHAQSIFDQAENRLHAQKAIMASII